MRWSILKGCALYLKRQKNEWTETFEWIEDYISKDKKMNEALHFIEFIDAQRERTLIKMQ